MVMDVNWVRKMEDSVDEVIDWPDTSEMPDHCFDYCFNIDLIASNDDYGDYHGAWSRPRSTSSRCV